MSILSLLIVIQVFKVVTLLRKINCVQFHLQKQVRAIQSFIIMFAR